MEIDVYVCAGESCAEDAAKACTVSLGILEAVS
jgi:hypothetical protein